MKFKNLTAKDKNYIQTVHADNSLSWQLRMDTLISRFEVSQRTIRNWIKKLGFSKPTEDSAEYKVAQYNKYKKGKKRFIITWAQNATPVHKNFYSNMIEYAKHIDAGVHVIAGRYRNPTSVFSDKDHDWWDLPNDNKYLDAARQNIHPYLTILSDVKVQPTASNPLTGFEGITGEESCIIGHPKVHTKFLPVLDGHPPKALMSTGACTIKNYTDSKAGKKAAFHHTYGFIVVEIKDGDQFFFRQVTADKNGNFNDLIHKVENQKITKIEDISSVVFGDIHHAVLDKPVWKKKLKFYEKFNVGSYVMHDVFDGKSINHHNRDNPITQYKLHLEGSRDLKKEIKGLKKFMLDFCNKFSDSEVKVVRSNHDDFLDRWVTFQDWKKEIHNCREFMEYALILLKDEAPKGLIPYILDEMDIDNLETFGLNFSYVVKSWELAQHGDIGQSGSRGSLVQFSKQNTKSIIGHSHTPGRLDGAVQVGTSTELRQDYMKGANSCLNSDAIIHTDGKVQQLHWINGQVTTFKV